MEAVMSAPGWSRRVRIARSFGERFSGLRNAPADRAMLFRTRSVHGFGMKRPLFAVGLSQDLTVLGVATLRPNRVVSFRQARYILELPVDSTVPQVGTRMELSRG